MSGPIVKLSILKNEGGDFPASHYAQQLRQTIIDFAPPGTSVDRVSSDPENMDLGSTLVIGVGTSLIAGAVIEGVKWLSVKYQGRVRVRLEIAGKALLVEGTEEDLNALLVEVAKHTTPPAASSGSLE
jgi:hypothetical protein